MISNRRSQFFGVVIISMLFWGAFDFANISVSNWSYSGLGGLSVGGSALRNFYGSIAFATVLPAFFETVELIRTFKIFEKNKIHKKLKVSKKFLHWVMGLGIVCFLAPMVLPKFAFPLVWLSFFFFLDPVNYMHKQPSIIGYLKKGKWTIPLSLLLAGIIMGFFWEFWNFWAVPKWTYNIPFVGFFKIFEMPILGYLGYFPFAFELYAMYWFVRSLFVHKEHLLYE